MSFPARVQEDALVACGRHCCLCHKFCGIKIELHHIRPQSEGGPNTFENCIALCFDCHADMRTYDHKHPKGTKYTETELIRHRNAWHEKIRANIGVITLPEYLELDKQIFQRLTELLSWQSSIAFIRNHYFANPFLWRNLDGLYKFWEACDDPAFEFLDPDLEGLRALLLQGVIILINELSVTTFPLDRPGDQVNGISKAYTHEEYEENRKVIEDLTQKAKSIVETYDALIKLSRRKLGVSPARTIT
jgi:HNH endonuclease